MKNEDETGITPRIKKTNEDVLSITGLNIHSVGNSEERHQHSVSSSYCATAVCISMECQMEGVLLDGRNLGSPRRRRFLK